MARKTGALLALLLCFSITMAVFAAIGAHFTDADMASELVYADLLNREGSLHTGNWFYSSELRIVAPTPVYRLALTLFPDWHAARVFSAGALLLAVLACWLYMTRPCAKTLGGIPAACVMLMPFGHVYAYFVCYGGHYTVHLCIIWLLLGMLLRAERRRGRIVRAALCLALSLWGGLGGLRVFMMFAAPAALAVAWEAFDSLRGASLREAAAKFPRGRLLLMGAILLGSAAGLAVNMRVLPARFDFDSHAATAVSIPTAEHFFAHLADYFAFFGLRESSRMLSLRGVMSFAAIAAGLLCAAAALCGARRADAPAEDRLLARYAAAAVGTGFLVNLLSENFGAQYYMAGLLVCVAAADSCAARMKDRPRAVRAALGLALTGVFALQAAVFVREEMPHRAAPEEQAASWLLENGYTRGYATFWHGAPITEASDGAIEVWVLEEPVFSDAWRRLGLNEFLQEKRHLSEAPEGPVFVCLFDEEAADPPAWADGAHLAKAAPWGSVYVYESAGELQALSAGG